METIDQVPMTDVNNQCDYTNLFYTTSNINAFIVHDITLERHMQQTYRGTT